MRGNLTLQSYDLILADDSLEARIRECFHQMSEQQKPSAAAIKRIMSYAAAFESVESEILGKLDLLKN
jgi:hypothetical protein